MYDGHLRVALLLNGSSGIVLDKGNRNVLMAEDLLSISTSLPSILFCFVKVEVNEMRLGGF